MLNKFVVAQSDLLASRQSKNANPHDNARKWWELRLLWQQASLEEKTMAVLAGFNAAGL